MFENIPRAIFLLSSQANVRILGREVEKDNLMTLDWMMPVSKDPALIAIAIKKERFTYRLIKESGVFALNLLPYSKRKAAEICGHRSGEFLDKFEESGLTRAECEKIHCPRVVEATFYLECEVRSEVEAGDHIIIIAGIAKSEGKRGKPLLHFMKSYFGVADAKR